MPKVDEPIKLDDAVLFDPEKHYPAIRWRDVLNKLEYMTVEELDQEVTWIEISPEEANGDGFSGYTFAPVLAIGTIPENHNQSHSSPSVGRPLVVPGQTYLIMDMASYGFGYPTLAQAKKKGLPDVG